MQTLSATPSIHPGIEQVTRCAGSRPGQGGISTAGLTADGFLRHQFLPLYEANANAPTKACASEPLSHSYKLLAQTYGLNLSLIEKYHYPYNVLLAHWDAERQLKRLNRDTELFIVQENANDFKFVVKETADTDRTLFHIPLLPLHRLIAGGTDKGSAELLLSVCAYLYHNAGIPHYRDEESYLYYHYEMLNDDLDNSWNELDQGDIDRNRSNLRYASHFGDVMQRRMHNPCHLERFAERVASFLPKDDFQRDCLAVAKEAFDLMQSYPDAHLFRNVANDRPEYNEDEDDDEYDDNNCIALYEYVHFVAEINGGIYQSISEMVNCEFNERQYTEEPAVVTRFDKSFTGQTASLDYERRLFRLINELVTILDQLQ